MSKKRILVDCDGILADFNLSCIKLINDKLGTNHKLHSLTDWDIFKVLNIKEHEHILDDAINNEKFCLNLSVFPGAVEALQKLEKDCGNVYIVTAPHRAQAWVHQRSEWLYQHFGITRDRVVYTHSKHVITGDVLIDDSAKNLKYWMEHHPTKLGIIWDRTYNQRYHHNPNYPPTRVRSWDEVFEHISQC